MEHYFERLQEAHKIIFRKLKNEFDHRNLGLTDTQFYILFSLAEKGSYTVSDLAEKLGVKPSAVTVMIDRLLKSDLVKRRRDAGDRRVVLIEISDEGNVLLEKVKAERKQVIKQFFGHLTPEELESLVAIYEKLANTVHK
ncbi:MarR family winged helix-turn-helix transcriptional regulator [Pseudalkalibacillus caeni]|uniref:MarR family winged helix-turn-helix transcriptional regulator n=1 Tax=Exobacillus caeni TaxID=2574798 RepID=UPI0014851FC6|nr:MarR family transcriptional regulator [Pseudalkalibacillus caeni]